MRKLSKLVFTVLALLGVVTVLVAPGGAAAATMTPFTALAIGVPTIPGWQVPGVDQTLMPDPSQCCQWRDAEYAFAWSGDIIGSSVLVVSRADNNIWGKETLTTATTTWEITFRGEVISGYGPVGTFVGQSSNGSVIRGTIDRGVRQGVILNL